MKKKLKIVQIEQKGNLEGNTKPQISASKYWCFTLHSEHLSEITEQLEQVFQDFCDFYIFSYELGKSGKTPHFQGYIETKDKIRPTELGLSKVIHWEKCAIRKHSARRTYNVKYICKEHGNNYKDILKLLKVKIFYNINQEDSLIKLIKDLFPYNYKANIKILDDDRLYDWQKDILSILTDDPHDRLIYWYWSKEGNVGKSTFCKYLVLKYNALVISGNAKDMKYAIKEWIDNTGEYPPIIILDVARSTNVKKLSYEGFEEVKNGLFFSGKYESGMCVGNPPHFLVFSNNEPVYDKMSQDRWQVLNIDNA